MKRTLNVLIFENFRMYKVYEDELEALMSQDEEVFSAYQEQFVDSDLLVTRWVRENKDKIIRMAVRVTRFDLSN